jgi:hypothetical protein
MELCEFVVIRYNGIALREKPDQYLKDFGGTFFRCVCARRY